MCHFNHLIIINQPSSYRVIAYFSGTLILVRLSNKAKDCNRCFLPPLQSYNSSVPICLISDKLSPNSSLNHSTLHPLRQWPSLLWPCLPFPSFGPSISSFPYRTSTKRVTFEDMSYSCQITVQSHIYYNYQKNLCSSSDGPTSKPTVTEKPGVTGKPGGGQTPRPGGQ